MAFTKILVPTDGSEFTKAAIREAVDLAKVSGGKITALYVIDQTLFGNVPVDSSVNAIYDMMDKEGHNATAFVNNGNLGVAVKGLYGGIHRGGECRECEEVVSRGQNGESHYSACRFFPFALLGLLSRGGFKV